MLDTPYVVVSPESKQVIYEAGSLAQAKGFTDACERGTLIFSAVEMFGTSYPHQICMLNIVTGEVLARGPVVDLDVAPRAMGNMRLALLPVLDAATIGEVPSC
jgi:hypothetical protein